MASAMAELAPSALQLLYSKAVAGKDYFVSGVSGAGYAHPAQLGNVTSAFAQLTGALMYKADHQVVNLLSDAACGPSCVAPFTSNAAVEGVISYFGDAYCGGAGEVFFNNRKPVVAARYALWQDHNNAASLAEKLRFLPKDARNPQSYSLIPVHVRAPFRPPPHCLPRVFTGLCLAALKYRCGLATSQVSSAQYTPLGPAGSTS